MAENDCKLVTPVLNIRMVQVHEMERSKLVRTGCEERPTGEGGPGKGGGYVGDSQGHHEAVGEINYQKD